MLGFKQGTLNFTAVADVVVTTNLEGTGKALRVVDFSFDGAYPAGGEVILPADVQLATIDSVSAHNKALTDFIPVWQPASGKMAVLVISTAAEAGAAAVGALVVRATIIGDREV